MHAGWLTAAISTVGTLSPNDLVFTADAFGSPNSATVTIRNVAIDRQVIAATDVPEPATLALLALGLLGVGLVRPRAI